MSFVEYQTKRTKKAPEDLESGKTWQVNARRLIVPINTKDYGLSIKKWTKDGKKHHSITWDKKPYAKLSLNQDKKDKHFGLLEINTQKGLAIQINPAKLDECYISIPKGALDYFPKSSCMLEMDKKGNKITLGK